MRKLLHHQLPFFIKIGLTSYIRISILIIHCFCLLNNSSIAQDVLWGLTQNGGASGAGTAFSLQSTGENYAVYKDFLSPPTNPRGNLVQASDGSLYGMTFSGGASNKGAIFKINADGSGLRVIKSFTGSLTDGANPQGSLVQGTDGNFYGMTQLGGTSNRGTIFKIAADGSSFSIIKSFTGSLTDGGNPSGSLVQGSDGNLYGMMPNGGTNGLGTIFKITGDGTSFSVIKSFTSPDGINPQGSLVQGSDGRFYGMTQNGGSNNRGTIFRMNVNGSGFLVLKHLVLAADGGHPLGSLIEGSDGNFYGMTQVGGSSGLGTIFKISGDGLIFSVIKHLTSANGANPRGSLVQGSDGNFYGLTHSGGTSTQGTIFKVSADGSGFSVVKSFNFSSDGANPLGSLMQSSDGRLYGMTQMGGTNNRGTIFKINVDGLGFSVISHLTSDGAHPLGSLVQGSDENFYGMTQFGGSSNYGTIFKINADGTGFSILKHLVSTTDGINPRGSLVQGSDGYFYGMAYSSSSGNGTILKINSDGSSFSVIKRLDYADGRNPSGNLVQGSDGYFYGMTQMGGSGNFGTIFKINADGSFFSVIKHFTNNAIYPRGSLIQGNDGSFYGMTYNGGTNNRGAIFKINADGSGFSIIKSFNFFSDGAHPLGDLVRGIDGNLYGMTNQGGSNGYGTIFKINIDGSMFSVIKHLASTDGANPSGNLVQGSDGSFYGITQNGGSSTFGTIFKINADGSSFSVLKHLTSADGANPMGSLIIQRKACTPPVASFTVEHVCLGKPTLFTDASTNVASDARYEWDFNNDGSVDNITKGNVTYTFASTGTYTTKLTIKQGTCEANFTQQVVVHALPTAMLSGDATICTGSSSNLSVVLTGTAPWTITYTDGSTPVTVSVLASPFSIPVNPINNKTYTLTALSDANCIGTSFSGSAIITVNSPPVLTVPTISSVNSEAGNCGATVAFEASATNTPTSAITYKIGEETITSPHSFPIGTTTVTATASNTCGMDTKSFTVTVEDKIAPTVTVKNITVELDATGNVSITAEDINNNSSDNCGIASLELDQTAFTCTDVGTNHVILTITDNNGNTATATATVIIENTAPTVSPITAPLSPVQINTSVSAGATFTDINLHKATWDWGNGARSEGIISGSVVTDNYSYTTPGVYTVTLTLEDICGETAQIVHQYIVIYDPTGGFVTGGGWINSPVGAYTANPAVIGKANFGFVSKYQKGATLPTGNTHFEFNAVGLHFKSTAYEWLVVSGAKAKYKGVGTINGSGSYGFLLSAIDGQVSGGGGIDKFRIKIWDKNNEDVIIYDNNIGSALGTGDDADPATAIGGGSIIIHADKGKARTDFESILQVEHAIDITAYPNPVSSKVTINLGGLPAKGISTILTEVAGKTLLQNAHKVTGESTLEIDISGVKTGMYLIELRSQQAYKILKVVKQ